MSDHDKEHANDHWKRKSYDDSSTNPRAGDDHSATERPRPQNTGAQNLGSLGDQPTGSPENVGKTGVHGALHHTHQPAGGGGGSVTQPAEPGDERTREVGIAGGQYPSGNFRLDTLVDFGAGGAKTKFRDNIAALQLLHQIEEKGHPATPAEQAILARYVGWGGIPQAFDNSNDSWENEYNQLVSLLSTEEYEAARASTLNAHYTSPEIIDGIYDGLKRLGLGDGVRLLEPAAGIGHFAGKLPFNASMTLNEIDSISARISRQLYPEFTTVQQGFENFRSPKDYFDAAVGNPPFGNYRLTDSLNPKISRFSIHNFFMAKSLDAVRPGGVTAMVVSRFFMDAKNKEHREYLADHAHFLGAIRLPEHTFQQNALTTVTTDIVFLQKARPGEVPERRWIDTGFVLCPNTGESLEINAWFINHPQQMIGRMQLESGAYAPAPQCVAEKGIDLHAEINNRLAVLPRNVFRPREPQHLELAQKEKPPVDFTDSPVRVDSFFITPDSRIGIRKPDMIGQGNYGYFEPRSVAEDERIRSAIELRDTLLQLINQETQDNANPITLDTLRQQLNAKYDKHVKKYDFLSSRSNKSVLKYDPLYPLLQSLEVDYDKGVSKTVAEQEGSTPRKASAQKAAIFSRRVNQPVKVASSAETAKDGLIIALNEVGRVDIPFIADLTEKDPSMVVKELHGLIYCNPETLDYETADQFLSGNVKKKLAKAKEIRDRLNDATPETLHHVHALLSEGAIERLTDQDAWLDEITRSITALEGIQPADIDAIDISVQLISTWLPEQDIRAFIREHLGIADKECRATYLAPTSKWVTQFRGGNQDLLHNTWGTERISANEILERMFANAPIQVKDIVGYQDDGTAIYRINQEETLAAQGKAEQIANAFSDWVWKQPERRDRLARRYNDRFNTHVPAIYNGSHLTLPQASGDITLRGTQKNAIWRGIQEGSGLFDHVVGAGKTLTAIATIMEQRRMRLINKPLVVVPNHLLGQWKDEFYKLYPSANVLVAEQTDFEKSQRKRLFATVATGDFDAVIIGHSSFKFLSLAPDDEAAFLREQVNDINSSLREHRNTLGRRDLSIKEMEKQKKRLEEKINKITDTGRKDDFLSFDQLGVDALFVDEADEFKNLAIVTAQSRIAGLGNLQGSEKAMDLFLKCRWLQNKREGKGVYFLTGTPISNSLAELYTMQRYMRHDELKEKGIAAFDSWSSTFGQVVSGWELDATGVNYRLNSRFAKFTNVPELMRMYRSFSDVVTQEDLATQARLDGTGRLVPKIKGGKPTSVIVPRSHWQAKFMGEMETVIDEQTGRPMFDASGREVKAWTHGSIIWRMENMPEDPRLDNALKVTHDARIAALDFRLVNPLAPDDAGSKVNEAVRRIYDTWEKNTYRNGTQLVFCDLSTPKRKFTAREENVALDTDADSNDVSLDEILGEHINPDTFSVYEDIKQKLIAKGIPENQVRFIHDATNGQKRAELFRAMNNGDVRILIGSTSKMGAGTNVQRRLVALHDLDCPWRPRDLEQRHGRIIRQGNMFFEQDKENFEVEIHCYATERTYDARMWQTIEVKARGIEQFRNGSLTDRVIEDIAGDAANAAEMKASATGNQLIFQQVKIDTEKRKQETLYRNWQRSRHTLEARLKQIPKEIKERENQLPRIENDVAYIAQHQHTPGLHTAATTFLWRKADSVKLPDNAVEQLETYIKDRLRHAVDRLANDLKGPVKIGRYRGMDIFVQASANASGIYTDLWLDRADGAELTLKDLELRYTARDTFSTTGLFTRLDNMLNDANLSVVKTHEQIARLKQDMVIVRESLDGDYPQKSYLDALRQDAIDVMAELKKMQDDEDYRSVWAPSSEGIERVATIPAVAVSAPASETLDLDFPPQQATPESPTAENILLAAAREEPGPDAASLTQSIDNSMSPFSPRQTNAGSSRSTDSGEIEPTTSDQPTTGDNSDYVTVPFKHGLVIFNTDNHRLQIQFHTRPEKGTEPHRIMQMLSETGRFFFAPSQNKRWVRKLNDKSVIAAANILHVELPLPSKIYAVQPDIVNDIPLSLTDVKVLGPSDIRNMEVKVNELFSRFNEGDGHEKDLFCAARQLAEIGSAEGKYLLSFCYFDGLGVETDNNAAIKLLHEAAGAGHAEACHKVGELYETGEYEHPIDLNNALKFYKIASTDVNEPALSRVRKKLEKETLSEKSGFRLILDKHKQQADSAEKFYSRMNLLYERQIEMENSRETLQRELEQLSQHQDKSLLTGVSTFSLDEMDNHALQSLNTYIMQRIKEAVMERKESGKPVELLIGKYINLDIKVRSVENALQFTLTGDSTWAPTELQYTKGEREKFKINEFLHTLTEFPNELKEKLNYSELRLAQLDEQIQAEQSKFSTAAVQNQTSNEKINPVNKLDSVNTDTQPNTHKPR